MYNSSFWGLSAMSTWRAPSHSALHLVVPATRASSTTLMGHAPSRNALHLVVTAKPYQQNNDTGMRRAAAPSSSAYPYRHLGTQVDPSKRHRTQHEAQAEWLHANQYEMNRPTGILSMLTVTNLTRMQHPLARMALWVVCLGVHNQPRLQVGLTT